MLQKRTWILILVALIALFGLQNTGVVKPPIDTPHRIMRMFSSGSSAGHFKWRWRTTTNVGKSTARSP